MLLQAETAWDIFEVSLDGDAMVKPLVVGPLTQWYPQISPDGKWIPYLSLERGVSSVHLMPFPDTGARWQLTEGLDRWDGGAWLEDGTAFIGRDGTGLFRIEMEFRGASVLSSPPRYILEEDNIRITGAGSYDITLDGKRAIVLQPEQATDGNDSRSIIFAQDWLGHLEEEVSSAQ